MKQEPETIHRFKNLTRCTLKSIKLALSNEPHNQKQSIALYTSMFNHYIDNLQTIILNLINDLGSEYLKIAKNLTNIGSVVLNLKVENQDLQEKLASAYTIIAEKDLKIQALEQSTSSLAQDLAALQNMVNLQYDQQTQELSFDSVQNQEEGDFSEYQSQSSSISAEGEELLQLGDQL